MTTLILCDLGRSSSGWRRALRELRCHAESLRALAEKSRARDVAEAPLGDSATDGSFQLSSMVEDDQWASPNEPEFSEDCSFDFVRGWD
jgi:hypothetical protein